MPRPRKPAHIYRRPGRAGWYAYLGREQKDIALGDVDEAEATRRLAELVSRRGVPVLAPADSVIADVFEICRARAVTGNTPKTVYGLHLNLARILRWLEERGVTTTRQIDRQVVEDYKSARRFKGERRATGGVSAARVNRELDSWKRAMRVAVEQGAADVSVLELFAHLREPRPEPHGRGLSRGELEVFLELVDERHRCLYRLVLGAGLRDDEVRHLEPGDVRSGSIMVTPKPGWSTKSYRYR
jgi:integrase